MRAELKVDGVQLGHSPDGSLWECSLVTDRRFILYLTVQLSNDQRKAETAIWTTI